MNNSSRRKEQVVVVQVAVLLFQIPVGPAHGIDVLGVVGQMEGLVLDEPGDILFLVPAFADEPEHGGFLGKGPVALAELQNFAGLLDQGLGIGLVHDGGTGVHAQFMGVASEDGKGRRRGRCRRMCRAGWPGGVPRPWSTISRAALRVKVRSRTASWGTPCSMSRASL